MLIIKINEAIKKFTETVYSSSTKKEKRTQSSVLDCRWSDEGVDSHDDSVPMTTNLASCPKFEIPYLSRATLS